MAQGRERVGLHSADFSVEQQLPHEKKASRREVKCQPSLRQPELPPEKKRTVNRGTAATKRPGEASTYHVIRAHQKPGITSLNTERPAGYWPTSIRLPTIRMMITKSKLPWILKIHHKPAPVLRFCYRYASSILWPHGVADSPPFAFLGSGLCLPGGCRG